MVSTLFLGGRAAAESGIERAKRAGFSALVHHRGHSGRRHARTRPAQRNGGAARIGSPFAKLPYLPEILAHPRWLAGFLADGGTPQLENIVIPGKGPMKLLDVSSALVDAAVSWGDLKWIRKVWDGPILVKGLLTGDDARRAIDEGVRRYRLQSRRAAA